MPHRPCIACCTLDVRFAADIRKAIEADAGRVRWCGFFAGGSSIGTHDAPRPGLSILLLDIDTVDDAAAVLAAAQAHRWRTVVCGHGAASQAVRALVEAGALTLLEKQNPPSTLVAAVLDATRGQDPSQN